MILPLTKSTNLPLLWYDLLALGWQCCGIAPFPVFRQPARGERWPSPQARRRLPGSPGEPGTGAGWPQGCHQGAYTPPESPQDLQHQHHSSKSALLSQTGESQESKHDYALQHAWYNGSCFGLEINSSLHCMVEYCLVEMFTCMCKWEDNVSWPEIHIYFHSRCEFALGISVMVISKRNVLHLTFRPGIMPVYTHFLLGKSIFTWHPWFIQYMCNFVTVPQEISVLV